MSTLLVFFCDLFLQLIWKSSSRNWASIVIMLRSMSHTQVILHNSLECTECIKHRHESRGLLKIPKIISPSRLKNTPPPMGLYLSLLYTKFALFWASYHHV